MKKMKINWKSNTMTKRVCTASTVILSLLLIMFLVVTTSGMNKLNRQIKLITEHPFVVSRHVGDVRTDVAQMRIRTERLRSYNQPTDVALVRGALNQLYESIEPPLQEIQRLYLGPAADADMMMNAFQEIRKRQQELLEYAAAQERTRDEIMALEQEQLLPLYELFEQGARSILSFTQNTQMTIYAYADDLFQTTLVWSLLIVGATIAGLLLFQYALGRLNSEICIKNQQFDTLSHTIDETFLIFENEKPTCDFVAENAQRVLGIPAKLLKADRKQIYAYMDEKTRAEMKSKLKSEDITYPCMLSLRYTHPQSKEKRWLLARFYRTSEGGSIRHIITLADQTEDIKAQRALQDALNNAQNANNAKRDFLSRMSHEIRTPMNAIIGMTTIAGASIEDRLRVEDCLAKISYSSKHLLMLINDILDMSRIESNKMSINQEPFDLYQFVNSFVSIIYSQAQSKGIQFSEKLVGFSGHTTYIGDSLRLNQVLLNLTSNAIKFTERGGSVTLEVKRIFSWDGKERVRFTVTDTGIGMTEEALERIYNPFEQADSGIAQKYGGTGLGMSITKNLVSLMGGFIDIKSQPGEGTACMVEIPLEKSDEELQVLSPEAMKALKVLVVDDERDICEHTVILLTKINIRAEWVLTGQEAVATVEAAREKGDGFDICFIDWNMPTMNGGETTRRIREKVGDHTPIIIITAYDWSEIEQEARQAGANAFISKPLFLSSIYNVLVSVTNGAFARTAAQSRQEEVTLKGKTILIAEDNDLNMEIAQEMIKMHDAVAECACNGQEAVKLFESSAPGHFDAILMDIQMPLMNGYEATQHIRALAHPDAKRIPIIATTANAFTEDMSAALAAGMNAHISKPIDMQKLCEMLAHMT